MNTMFVVATKVSVVYPIQVFTTRKSMTQIVRFHGLPIRACTQQFLGDGNIVHTSIYLQGVNPIDIWTNQLFGTQHRGKKMFCLLYSGLIVFIYAMLKFVSFHARKNVS
jgi:hypothetical protein